MRTILVTGAAGFIGSNFVRGILARNDDVRVVALDKLTYAGNLANLADVIEDYGPTTANRSAVATNPKTGEVISVPLRQKFWFVKGDVCDADLLSNIWTKHAIDSVVHFAAETHVDRSVMSSGPFVQTNVVGTQVLLDVAKAKGVSRFVLVSTDEVYGTLPEDRPDLKFTEETPLAPNSPYSASKAAADCLARSYFHTFGMPILITRCSNNYGPYQFPEKLIPLFVTNLIEGKKVPLYGDGLNVRDWLYVEDHCEAIQAVLDRGRAGEVYNIGGENELTNRRITETVLKEMGRPWDQSVEYVKDRPGHDRRYAIDASKIRGELGWSPRHIFDTAIRTTIDWYRQNAAWWRAVKSGEYLKFYEQQYGSR